MTTKTIIWFRNDLRIHDHAPLYEAAKISIETMPIYCVDPRQFASTSFGFPKTGRFRAQFLIESLIDLRASLKKLGSNLIIRLGYPETVIPSIAKQYEIDQVFFHREVTSEETTVESRLKEALQAQGISSQRFWGSTLYHPQDLPFPIKATPKVFTQFRREVEKRSCVNPVVSTPKQLPVLPDIEPGDIPCLTDLNVEEHASSPRALFEFRGGETAGQARVQSYIWQKNCLKQYKETRNGMLNPDDASRFSPWLALGCLSPRYIYEEVKRYERERVKNDSTYWLVFELIWRDYFRFICAKQGDRIFKVGGLQHLQLPWKTDRGLFQTWAQGQTGYPLVDANMRELAETGFMSNRGRQNVASFLTKNLGINWQMGAEWFESLLIDYDVCSNWGNWNYSAGVGNDARGFRFFNIVKQSKDYDPTGDYLRHWLPEIASMPNASIHTPWKLEPMEQTLFKVKIGQDYPAPIVDLHRSAKQNEKAYMKAIGK